MSFLRSFALLVSIILSSNFSSTALSATLNKCVHPDGRTEFSDQPCTTESSSSVVSPIQAIGRSQDQSQQAPRAGRTRERMQQIPPQKNDIVNNRNQQITSSQSVVPNQAMAVFTAWHQALNKKDFAAFKKLQYSNIGGNTSEREVYVKGVFDRLVEKVPSTFKMSEYKPPTNRQASLVSIGCKNNIRVGGVFTVLLHDGTWQVLDSDWVTGWEEAEPVNLPCTYEAGLAARKQKTLNKSPILVNGLTAEDRMKSCDPTVAVAAAQEIINNPDNMNEPMGLFPAAFVLFQNGKKDDGVFWFYATQLRVKQQMLIENGDRGQILSIMLMTMGPFINNYAFQNTSNLNKILDKVLKWDKDTVNPFRDEARAKKLDKQMEQVYAGFGEFKSKLISDKVSMESAARQAASEIDQMFAKMIAERCRKGLPDPAYANQAKKIEEQLALDWITNNAQVLKLAGGAVRTFPAASTIYSNDRNRGRYDFSISYPKDSTKGRKAFYAIVDVDRKSGKSEFTLACVTTLSMGQREAFKDVCTQSTIPLPK